MAGRVRNSNVNCCVAGCNSTYRNVNETVSFHRFPKKDRLPHQYQRWLAAIKRDNADKTQWTPTPNSRICSKHFVGNRVSKDPQNLAYAPSIFPDIHRRKVNAQQSMNRYNSFANGKPSVSSSGSQFEDHFSCVPHASSAEGSSQFVDAETQSSCFTTTLQPEVAIMFSSSTVRFGNKTDSSTQADLPQAVSACTSTQTDLLASHQLHVFKTQKPGPVACGPDFSREKETNCAGFHGFETIESDTEMIDTGVKRSGFVMFVMVCSD